MEKASLETPEQSPERTIKEEIVEQIAILKQKTVEIVQQLPEKLDSIRLRLLSRFTDIRPLVIAAAVSGIILTSFLWSAIETKASLELPPRTDTAYVLIIGDDVSGMERWAAKEDLKIILSVTGDDFPEEVQSKRIQVLSTHPLDFDADGVDDRAVDTSQLSTEQLNQAVIAALQNAVMLAQRGEVDEVVLHYFGHGNYDGTDWLGTGLNKRDAKVFEQSIYSGLEGLPKETIVRFLVESCFSGAIPYGERRFTDEVPNSTVWTSAQANQVSIGQASNSMQFLVWLGLGGAGIGENNFGEAFQSYSKALQDFANDPGTQSSGRLAYRTDFSGGESVPPGVGTHISLAGSVEEVDQTLSQFGYSLTVVDRVRNTTSDTITYTVASTDTMPGFTMTVPPEIVIDPHSSRHVTLTVKGPFSATQFVTTMMHLSASNGIPLSVFQDWANPDFVAGLEFAPPDSPGSYKVISDEFGNPVYEVTLPITSTFEHTQSLPLLVQDVDTGESRTQRLELESSSFFTPITLTFRNVLPHSIGVGIYLPSGREVVDRFFDTANLDREGEVVYIPFVITD